MTFVRGKIGSYTAGNLFLFPGSSPKDARSAQSKVWPRGGTGRAQRNMCTASPIPSASLPQDEYFCRIVLKAPWPYFIGFTVDAPFRADQANLRWFSNVDKLGDGNGVGIDWTSSEPQPSLVWRQQLHPDNRMHATEMRGAR